jgi:hypothetical protein
VSSRSRITDISDLTASWTRFLDVNFSADVVINFFGFFLILDDKNVFNLIQFGVCIGRVITGLVRDDVIFLSFFGCVGMSVIFRSVTVFLFTIFIICVIFGTVIFTMLLNHLALCGSMIALPVNVTVFLRTVGLVVLKICSFIFS